MASRLADRVRALDIQLKAYKILWRQTQRTVKRELTDRAYVLQTMRGLHKNITALKAGQRDLDIVWRAVHETRRPGPVPKNVLETMDGNMGPFASAISVALLFALLGAAIWGIYQLAPVVFDAFCALAWAAWCVLCWAESAWRAHR